jgi:protein TonB
MGMTGQAMLLACAIVIPLWFPAALPRPQALMLWIAAPGPPPAPPVVRTEAVAAPRMRPLQLADYRLYEPVNIPARAVMIEDPPLPEGANVFASAGSGKDVADLMAGILTPPAQAPAAAPVVHAPPPAAPAAPPRVRVGTGVKAAEVIERIAPVYPALARQSRISGVVELEGVVGIDGHIRELRVISGHPLLVRAALDAVAQWRFRPTLLNGEPVEIVQPVIVRFNLQ